MDKNKSAYKLKGFGPVYVINLDGQPERWQWMKEQLDYWQELHRYRNNFYLPLEENLFFHKGF